MISKLARVFKVFICFVLITQLAGCGTLLYPERRGQRGGGRIDGGVAVMDGVGLLLFIVPGLVAFIVDFSTGAIYLPGSSRSSLDLKDMKVAKFDPSHYTNETLEGIVKRETGFTVKLNQPGLKVVKLKDKEDLKKNLVN